MISTERVRSVAGVISSVEVLSDDGAFADLEREWDKLLEASDQRVFFLRWSWNRHWWENFKPPGSRLYLVTCRDDFGRLVALAPFYWKPRRTLGIPHVRDLCFLGTGVYAQTSEYLNIIVRGGYEKQAASALVQFLRGRADWDRLWLREVPSTSTVLSEMMTALGDSAVLAPCNRSHFIDTTVNWETFVESLSRSTRKHLKRQMRKFNEKYRCRFGRVESEDALDPALDALVRLHQARWQSKDEPGSFVIPGFESLVRDAARSALPAGRLRLWTLELDGKVAAVRLAFLDNEVVHAIQGGFDPDYAKDSLGSVMLGMCIKDCIDDPDVRAYDFMGGTDTYKDWWTKLGNETVTMTYVRPGIRGYLYQAILTMTRVIKPVLRRLMPADIRMALHRWMVRRRMGPQSM